MYIFTSERYIFILLSSMSYSDAYPKYTRSRGPLVCRGKVIDLGNFLSLSWVESEISQNSADPGIWLVFTWSVPPKTGVRI